MSLPTGVVGKAYSQAIGAGGGSGTGFSFARTAGSLPPGLTLSAAGLMHGTPTAKGTFHFTVRARDDLGRTGSRSYTLTIQPTLALGPATLPAGTAGTAYSTTVSGSGGSGSYRFTVMTGALPGGLSLDRDTGMLSGTPTVASTFSFTVTATDSGGRTGNRAYTLTVSPALTLSPAALPAGTVGVSYGQTLSASGGRGYVFTVLAGALPDGLDLSPEGALLGTPSAAGTFDFTVLAQDSTGLTGSRVYRLTIGL